MPRRRRCGRVAFGLWPNVVEPQARRYNDLGWRRDANSFWMIFQPLRSWLISGVPLGQVRTKFHEGEMRKIILGWTIGAIGV